MGPQQEITRISPWLRLQCLAAVSKSNRFRAADESTSMGLPVATGTSSKPKVAIDSRAAEFCLEARKSTARCQGRDTEPGTYTSHHPKLLNPYLFYQGNWEARGRTTGEKGALFSRLSLISKDYSNDLAKVAFSLANTKIYCYFHSNYHTTLAS